MITLTLSRDAAGLSLCFNGDISEVDEIKPSLCCLGDRYTRHNWEPGGANTRIVRLTPKFPHSACPQVDIQLLKRFLVQNQKTAGVTNYEFINLFEEV